MMGLRDLRHQGRQTTWANGYECLEPREVGCDDTGELQLQHVSQEEKEEPIKRLISLWEEGYRDTGITFGKGVP